MGIARTGAGAAAMFAGGFVYGSCTTGHDAGVPFGQTHSNGTQLSESSASLYPGSHEAQPRSSMPLHATCIAGLPGERKAAGGREGRFVGTEGFVGREGGREGQGQREDGSGRQGG